MRKPFALFGALALICGLSFACDENSDDTEENEVQKGEGFAESCTPLGPKETTDFSYTTKAGAAQYLVDICKLPEYFTSSEFQNAKTEDQGIGATCFCYGKNCSYMGYERPEQTTLYGCDGIPEVYNGAQRSCFRSSNVSNIKPSIYFPQGACSLAMSKCRPDNEAARQTICGFATFGDPAYGKEAANTAYDQKIAEFVDCPNGEVLLDFVMNISINGLSCEDKPTCDASLDIRACFKGCNTDADCHGAGDTNFDTVVQEYSQTKCVEAQNKDKTQKAKVCFDMRTVAGTDGITLVNPGNYAVE